MLEMINVVFPNSALMLSSSRWGSDSDSADDNCMEQRWSKPLPWPW